MAHPSVSRSHALIVVDRLLGAHLVDLGTSNGSFVDGRVRCPPYFLDPKPVAHHVVRTQARETFQAGGKGSCVQLAGSRVCPSEVVSDRVLELSF